MKMAIVLFLIFSSLWANEQYRELIEKYQKVVSFYSPEQISSLEKDVGGQVQIVARGKLFAVIRPQKEMTKKGYDEFLESLKKKKYIKEIKDDSIAVPRRPFEDIPLSGRDRSDCVDCGQTVGLPSELPLDMFKGLFDSRGECTLYPKCGDNNPAWAKLQMGADLAENLIEQLAPAERTVATVAVVDSGFDQRASNNFQVAALSMDKGHDSAGDPLRDIDGHGTAVSGMIGARDIGITSHINLNVYRVTDENAGGSTSTAFLAAAIEKACQKADIVNLSWGSMVDEIGLQDITKELWYREAVAKGCIVVKAAGNSGVKRNARPVDLKAPFVSVAASQSFGGEASFSTNGLITAPGEGVFSVLSAQHEYSDYTSSNSCQKNGSSIGPINGTSFASPAVAGVLGQIVTVLRARGKLPADPVKKVELVKSILFASTQMGDYFKNDQMVNALGAVLIASNVNGYTTDQKELVRLGQEKAASTCNSQVHKCAEDNQCQQKQKCVNQLRFKALVCVPINKDDAKNLYESLSKMKERELLNSLNYNLPEGMVDISLIRNNLESSWRNNLRSGRIDDIDLAFNHLESSLSAGVPNFINFARMKELMSSFDFNNKFSINSAMGENIWNSSKEEYYGRFISLIKSLPLAEQKKLVESMPVDDFNLSGQLGVLYLMRLNADSFFPEVQQVLADKLVAMSGKWYRGELKFLYGELDYVRNVPVFDMFMEVNPQLKGRLQKEIDNPISPSNIHLASYALSSEIALSKDESAQLALRVIESKKTSTSSDDLYMINAAIDRLFEESSAATRRELESVYLTSSIAELPSSYFSSFSFLSKDQNPLRESSQDFWTQLANKNAQQTIQTLDKGSDGLDHVTVSKAFDNLIRATFYNPSDNAKHLFSEQKENLKKIIEVAIPIYIGMDHSSWRKTALQSLALNVVETMLDLQNKFEQQEDKELLQQAFAGLRPDVNKINIPQDIRQKLRRLYDLGEE